MRKLAIEMHCMRMHKFVIDLHPGSNCILFIELFTNRHVKKIYLHVEINKRIQLFTQNMFHIISVNTACVDVD
jgi:hypothetical protein